MQRLCSIVLALASLAIVPERALGQTFDGGAKGGASLSDLPKLASNLEDAGVDDLEWRWGRALGGFVAIGLSDHLAFQPEVLWTQKGLKGQEPFLGNTIKLELEYIEVPLLLRIGPSSGRGFHVLAGPSINFLTKAHAIEEGDLGDYEDIKDESESVDVGLAVAAGYYGGLLLVEGRFEEGLRSVPRSPEDDESYRNRAFMILGGIRFGR